MDKDSVRSLAEDYIRYCLAKKHRAATPPPLTDIQRAMRVLCDDLESDYGTALMNINKLRITPGTARDIFQSCTESTFTEVNWGRIIAFFVFAGKFAVLCDQRSMPRLVDSVVDWTASSVYYNLGSWISSNGGWNELVERAEQKNRGKSSWLWRSFFFNSTLRWLL